MRIALSESGSVTLVDPLCSHRSDTVTVEFSSQCAVRCVYCAVSQPDYHGEHMRGALLEEISSFLEGRNLKLLCLSGHGETTMVPDWHKQCEPFIQGFPCSLTSSFSKLFTSDELMTLVDLESITISVDCADEVLLRSVRRKVSLQTILQNIQNLRETAKAHHISPPRLVFSAGVYDRNVFVLEDLAELAVRLKISKVIFWNYVEQPEQPSCPVRPINTFDKETHAAALDCLQRAVQKLRASGIAVELAGNFAASTRAGLLPPVPELNADRAVAK